MREPLVTYWARKSPDAPALIAASETTSWATLDGRSRQMARRLRALGIGSGDRVAVVSENAPELVELLHAAPRLGACVAFLHARRTVDELLEQARIVRPTAVLCATADRPRLAALSPIDFGALAALAGRDGDDLPPDPSRIVTILFTSGTSGRPRAVALSLGNHLASARASSLHQGDSGPERWLASLPLYHAGGLAMVFRAAASEGSVVLPSGSDAGSVLDLLRAHDVTHLSLVPTTLGRLLDVLDRDGPWPPSVRVLFVGGAPLSPALIERCERFGIAAQATYGLTETASQVATLRRAECADKRGTVGRVLPGTRVRIVDDSRRPLPAGVAGSIEVCGPTVMAGYFGDAEATAAVLRDGWLLTGDVGQLDAGGFLTVHARRDDLILTGGENVYPAHVEAALSAVAGVKEAAVVGIEDSEWGQVVAAAVVLDGDAGVQTLADACAARLAPFERPKRFLRVAELPRTPSGKVDRAHLRALLAADGSSYGAGTSSGLNR